MVLRHFRNGITSFQEWYYVISGMQTRLKTFPVKHFKNRNFI